MKKIILFIIIITIECILSAATIRVQEYYNNFIFDEESNDLVINDIIGGQYFIDIKFSVSNYEVMRSQHNHRAIIYLLVSDGKKEIFKEVEIELTKGIIGKSELLFKIPWNFWYGKDIIITIQDIWYDEEIKEYFDGVKIGVYRRTWNWR